MAVKFEDSRRADPHKFMRLACGRLNLKFSVAHGKIKIKKKEKIANI